MIFIVIFRLVLSSKFLDPLIFFFFFFARETRKEGKSGDIEPEIRLRTTHPFKTRTTSIWSGHKFGSKFLSSQLKKEKLVIYAAPSVPKQNAPDAQGLASLFSVPRTGKDLSHDPPKKESL